MPLIIPNGYAQASIEIRHASLARPTVVTFGLAKPSAFAQSDADTVLNAWDGSFTDEMDNQTQSGPATLRVGPGPDYTTFVSAVGPYGGGNAISSLPPNNAVLFHKRTARGGRRGRGRMYVPWCIAQADVNESGAISALRRTALTSAMTSFFSVLAVAGLEGVVLHNSEGTTAAGAPDDVVSVDADGTISNQRRRLGR